LVWTAWYGVFTIFIPVYVFLLLPAFTIISTDATRNFLERTAETQWGLMICVYCISHVPALLILTIPNYDPAMLVVFVILVVQSSDVLQYVWGKLMGKHKVAPHVSPSKTLEGFIGGILSATAFGTSLWWITPFRPWQAAIFSFLITMTGFLGGLVMSAIKRDAGVKDYGHLIGGHGGEDGDSDELTFDEWNGSTIEDEGSEADKARGREHPTNLDELEEVRFYRTRSTLKPFQKLHLHVRRLQASSVNTITTEDRPKLRQAVHELIEELAQLEEALNESGAE